MMPRKHPAAVALGRRGGKANTPAQYAARSRAASIAQEAARKYRLTPSGGVQKRDATGRWLDLEPPYDLGTRRFLRRQGVR